MASNRDPQKDYRINRRGRKVTSSADRSKRVKKSTVPKPTSSSTRSRGSGTGSKRVTSDSGRVKKNPVSGGPRGAQGPRTAPQQGPSRPVKGLIGSRGTSKSKPPIPKTPKAPGRFTPKPKVKAKAGGAGASAAAQVGLTIASKLAETIGKSGQSRMSKLGIQGPAKPKSKVKPKAKPTESIGKYNTRDEDGTVRSRLKVGPKKVGPKKVGTLAQDFDRAFAAARKAGKSTFTWRGKKYTTKMK